MTDWSKPVPVDDVTLAFPACVIGTLLPPVEDIPSAFLDGTAQPWCGHADRLFASGGVRVTQCQNIDDPVAVERQINACLRSYEPKHEHKIAGVAYLLSLFYRDA